MYNTAKQGGSMKKVRTTKMKNISDGEAGYIAGIMDGEGHMYVRKEYEGSTHAIIRVRITSKSLADWLHSTTGVGSVCHYVPSQRRKDGNEKKRVYEWCVMNRADVEAVVVRIEPWLIIKKEHAFIIREVEALKQQGVFNGAGMADLKSRLSKLSIR